MTKSFLNYSLICLLSIISFGALAQSTFKVTNTSSIGFLEYLPANYNSNSDKYPIVIFLHGLGERGPQSTNYNNLRDGISTVERHGPAKHVKEGQEFPFILISPQLKSNYGDWPTWYVNEVIDYCKTYLRIDERRIYLTGLSLGGGGTWNTAQDEPKLFAAIAPVCGSRNSTAKACLLTAENLPVWGFHGDRDHTVGIARTINMVNAINNCNPTPNPRAKITIYPGVSHNAWDKAYTPDHSIHNPNLYEWMLSYTNTVNGSNKIPLANAGADQLITESNITISGSGYDNDGSIESYLWEKLSGPPANLTNVNTARLNVSNLTTGVYIFRLRVTDNRGDSDSDYLKVTVQSSGNRNSPPMANAGVDRAIVLPSNSISINGTASDSDGQVVNYQWTEVSDNAVTLSGTTSPTLKVSSLKSGAYVFRFTVTDNNGATRSDEMTLNVTSPPNNTLPVVNAGIDRIIKLSSTKVTLFGSASDVDGKIVSHRWTKISGGSCYFSNSNVLRPRLSNFSTGRYVFRLTVTDNDGNEGTDEVIYTFNHEPIANAGKDYHISTGTKSLLLTGSATDVDGRIVKYSWTVETGPKVKLSDYNTSKLKVDELRKGNYTFKLVVTDNAGLEGIDYATVRVVSNINAKFSITQAADSISKNSFNDTVNIEASQWPIKNAEEEFSLTTQQDKLRDCIVIIFDDNGRKIFEGQWSEAQFRETFTRSGIYIYHIIKNGKRSTGKIYIN